MKNTAVILTLFLSCAAIVGCRASRELKASERRTQSAEIDVEAHRLDSLWSLLTERYRVHIEFFNPNAVLPHPYNLPESAGGSPEPSSMATLQGAAPLPGMSANSQFSPQGVCAGVGGLGAVKSIDIEAERTQSEQSLSQADSTAVFKTESDEARQKEKASETRQDNGTWAIVSVVAGVVFLAALVIIIKKLLKR